MEKLFWISLILLFYTFIGYPISLELINKIVKKKIVRKSKDYKPNISFIIAAHNEEKSIIKKIENIISLNYEKEKIEVIIASDNSTDTTNILIEQYIKKNGLNNFRLYIVKERKGKTNAQNEAVKEAKGEVLVFSDANSIWENNALEKLIENFFDEKISYVCGKLKYVNSFDNITSNAENTYWDYDLKMRKIESDHESITAGNGAIYAIRKSDYVEIDPIECHDGSYPTLAVLMKKRAIYEELAIAYEKAGESSEDEFSRKVRMGRTILKAKYSNFSKYNPFKTGLYSYFYFCHRYLRYSLYSLHLIIFFTNLTIYKYHKIYALFFILQTLFYFCALMGSITKFNNKVLYYPYYYILTLYAQLISIKKGIFRENKPFWEKAETTR